MISRRQAGLPLCSICLVARPGGVSPCDRPEPGVIVIYIFDTRVRIFLHGLQSIDFKNDIVTNSNCTLALRPFPQD